MLRPNWREAVRGILAPSPATRAGMLGSNTAICASVETLLGAGYINYSWLIA